MNNKEDYEDGNNAISLRLLENNEQLLNLNKNTISPNEWASCFLCLSTIIQHRNWTVVRAAEQTNKISTMHHNF